MTFVLGLDNGDEVTIEQAATDLDEIMSRGADPTGHVTLRTEHGETRFMIAHIVYWFDPAVDKPTAIAEARDAALAKVRGLYDEAAVTADGEKAVSLAPAEIAALLGEPLPPEKRPEPTPEPKPTPDPIVVPPSKADRPRARPARPR